MQKSRMKSRLKSVCFFSLSGSVGSMGDRLAEKGEGDETI
jgi:hypothetical protein